MTGDDLLTRIRSGGPTGGDRAVSFTVSYVLTVAIAVVLVAGLLITVGQVVTDRRVETIRGEASVVGDQTAAAVMAADRLVRGGTQSNVSLQLGLPDRLAGQPYTVSVRASDSAGVVEVRTRSPSVAVTVPLTNRTRIRNTTVAGSGVRVVYSASDGWLTLAGGES